MTALPNLSARFSNWLVAWRWPLLALGIVAAAMAWLPAQNLEFDRAIDNMFAPHDPLLPPFRLLKRTFGGDEVVLAAYVDPRLLTTAGLKRLDGLTRQLEQVEGVQGVISLSSLPASLAGDLTRSDNRLLELFEGYLIGEDRQTTAVVCLLSPHTEAVSRGATIQRLRKIIALHDPSGVLAGEPVMVVDGFDYVQQDGRRLQQTSTLLLALVIVVCFRSLRWVIVPLAIVQATMLWTHAVLVMGQWQLSMVSSMLAAIVTVVGVAGAMHVIVRFREIRQQGTAPSRALAMAGAIVAVPLLWSCLTDAGGFGALLAGSVGPVRDFGLMMAIGSLLVPFSVALLLPGLALLGSIDADPRRMWGEDHLDTSLERLLSVILRRPWTYGLICLLVAGILSAGSYRMEVETDFTRNFRQHSPIVTSYRFVESRLGGAGVWDVILPAPAKLDFEYVQRVRHLEERLRSEVMVEDESGQRVHGLTKVFSLADALDAGPIKLESLPAALRGPALTLGLSQIQQQMPVIARALRGEDPQHPGRHYYRIMLRARERQPSAAKQQIISAVRRICREEFPQAEVTGFFVLLTNLIDSLLADQWLTFAVATAAITPMLLFALRSIPLTLIAFVPNALPITMVMGLMGWLGFPINMGAAMIAAVSIGLSVDSSLHYLMDFKRLREEGRSMHEVLHTLHQSVGRAAVFSTLALIIGFSALAQSQFVPTIYFGVLVSLAMLGGLVGNLVMVPLLLVLVTPERQVRL